MWDLKTEDCVSLGRPEEALAHHLADMLPGAAAPTALAATDASPAVAAAAADAAADAGPPAEDDIAAPETVRELLHQLTYG